MVQVSGPDPAASLSAWLLEGASATSAEALIDAFAARLLDAGVPLWRMRVAVLAMHPEVYSRAIAWRRDQPIEVRAATFDLLSTPAYVGSPVQRIHAGVDMLHCRIDVPKEALPFPQLEELRAQGGTDYLIFALVFGDGRRSFISFTTDHPDGFRASHVALLRSLLPLLRLRLELESAHFSTRTLLNVYVGRDAAERVLAGQFRRGTGKLIRAAVWMCDLRGFTALVDRLPVTDVIPVLDRYFETVAGPVTRRGGEVLKFIGDAMLAVFPVGDDVGPSCRNAVDAAQEALSDFSRQPIAAEHGLRIGVAVNLGEVMYGNIGAADRLDFTVIGSAVNEAARMEALCKALKTPLIIARSVAAHLPEESLVSLGEHTLRGVAAPQELFTLRAFSPA